jgi:hypothetical protein
MGGSRPLNSVVRHHPTMKWRYLCFVGVATLVICTAVSGSTYRLSSCTVSADDASIYLRFVSEDRAIRTISVGPTGVVLGGNVKMTASPGQIKEFFLGPSLELTLVRIAGERVQLGVITPECRTDLKRIAGPRIHVREGDV